MNYSRRQLEALGQPFGNSATQKKLGGGYVLGGGGFVAETVADFATDAAVDSVVSDVGTEGLSGSLDFGQDLISPEQFAEVNNQIVGDFAGDPAWWDANYPTDVTTSAENVNFSDYSTPPTGSTAEFNPASGPSPVDPASNNQVPATGSTAEPSVVTDPGLASNPYDVELNTPVKDPTIAERVTDVINNPQDYLAQIGKQTQQIAINQLKGIASQTLPKSVSIGGISVPTAAAANVIGRSIASAAGNVNPRVNPQVAINIDPQQGPAFDDNGNLNPGWELVDGDPVYVGPNVASAAGSVNPNVNPQVAINTDPQQGPAFDDNGNLNPGWQLVDGDPVYVGPNIVGPDSTTVTSGLQVASAGAVSNILAAANSAGTESAAVLQALKQQAQNRQTIADQRMNRGSLGDWRVRLRLAPRSNYLYNAPAPGILSPLKTTDGVIFPYTPTINTSYKANYSPYDLTHSNYRGYFYQNSYVDTISIKGMFTAQDTNEADYLLAVIHFFRSVTKMFYGQDALRGAPPPLVYLSGFGQFQFSEHPCVVSNFSYNLPSEVNYIRADSNMVNGNRNQDQNTDGQNLPTNPLSAALYRLFNARLPKGALPIRIPNSASPFNIDGQSTYVPTKMDIDIQLYPIQSRSQVSQQFSLENFANGNLLKGGFW